jgi:hypothetical protein
VTSAPAATDPVLAAVGRAVAEDHSGDADSARRALLDLWARTGVTSHPLHRRTLAHHLADPHPDPAQAPAWGVRALDAADAVTEQRRSRRRPHASARPGRTPPASRQAPAAN